MTSKTAFVAHMPFFYDACHWILDQKKMPSLKFTMEYTGKLVEVIQCYGLLLCDNDFDKYNILVHIVLETNECPSPEAIYDFLFSPAIPKSRLN